MLKSDVFTRICTQLTFDLILGLLGHFRTWHLPLSFLKHIKIHFEHGCQNVLKMPTDFFFTLWMANYAPFEVVDVLLSIHCLR